MTSAADPRQALRDARLGKRKQLTAAERLDAARRLRDILEQLPEFMVDSHIAGYWACAGELPLNLAIAGLAEREQTFYLPVLAGLRQLRFAPWDTGEPVAPNRHGIPEPTQTGRSRAPDALDLVLVPLVGFDRHGNRLGMGGGYYDRSFAFLRERARPATPLLVGIGYAFQECEPVAAAPWDVRLDYIATERELIDCTGTGETAA
jgi:5-formyltetrahydrofolate cyclo-ligase